MIQAKGMAALSAKTPLAPFTFERREPKEHDVVIDIKFCGICHSDIHQARNEWGGSMFPMVPGHEIAGVVRAVGSKVSRHQVGDTVGIGCFVDSCRVCAHCKQELDQYCLEGNTQTYNSYERDGKSRTQGGYSNVIVADENYVLKIARALGAEVSVLSHSEKKREDALKLGAHHFISTHDKEVFKKYSNYFDLIINTVSSADIDMHEYFGLLKLDATLVSVGAPDKPLAISPFPLILMRRNFAGSVIGSIKETQEMLDFCAKHKITPEIELIAPEEVNMAYERILKSDVRYRFVIDMAKI